MWDVIVSNLVSNLQGGAAVGLKQFDPPSRVSSGTEGSEFAFKATEHREGVLWVLLQGLGLVDPPAELTYKAGPDGVGFSLRTGIQGNYSSESDVFVARKSINCVARSFSRPHSLIFWVIGILTCFTLVGPVVAYLLYKRQKHTASFGFDTDSDIGLVVTFVGNASIDQQLRPLWAQGMSYVSRCETADGVAYGDGVALAAESGRIATAPRGGAGQSGTSPGKILVGINGEVQSVTRQQLVEMARLGQLTSSDKVSTDGQKWLPAGNIRGLFSGQ